MGLDSSVLHSQIAEMPTAIDLFCGAGGLSLGLKRAGFSVSLAVDNWSAAKDTYSENFPGVPFLLEDIKSLRGVDLLREAGFSLADAPTLIAGGPPCQGFSSAGRQEPQDPRNTLVNAFSSLIAELRVPFFLFENVEGFLTVGRGSAVFEFLDPIVEAGYKVDLRKINAANYGVPQLRKRVLAIGSLSGIPSYPSPTHRAHGSPGAHLAGKDLPRVPTLQEAIGDLEHRMMGLFDGHVRETLTGLDLQRSISLRPGQTMRDLPDELQHVSYSKRANRRVRDGMPTERRGGAPAGIRRLRPDEPSKAITGSATNEFLHPSLNSFLTIRECARLQTFPDQFNFIGTKREQALLIGNAVPPDLAEKFGISMLSDCVSLRESKSVPSMGRLLSFSPTLSSGMSPILSEVVGLVKKRYGLNIQETIGSQLGSVDISLLRVIPGK